MKERSDGVRPDPRFATPGAVPAGACLLDFTTAQLGKQLDGLQGLG